MYCENATKGKINYRLANGKKEIIEVPTAPFSVSCNPIGACGRNGKRKINWTTSRGGACNNLTSGITFDSFENEILYFKAVPTAGAWGGNRYDLWGKCPNGDRVIRSSFSIQCGAVNITSNTFIRDENTGLIVKNQQGSILFNVFVDKCDYQVSCDDKCPPHHIRCESTKYPGYCCIPCKETAQKIQNLANKIVTL